MWDSAGGEVGVEDTVEPRDGDKAPVLSQIVSKVEDALQL